MSDCNSYVSSSDLQLAALSPASSNTSQEQGDHPPSIGSNEINQNSQELNIFKLQQGEDRICLICGDKANGVHYNVLSCEGCKSFFLRNTKQKTIFECLQGGKCDMDLYTRRHCPACRMKRCLECGMNIERVWGKKRLQTRKPLVRTKRKRKRPASPESAPPSPQLNQPQVYLSQEQSDLLNQLEKGYYASTDLFRNIVRGIPEKFVNFWTQATRISQDIDDKNSTNNIITNRGDQDNNTSAEANIRVGTRLPSIHKVTEYLSRGYVSNKTMKLPEHRETVHKEMLHLAMDMFATVVKQTIHFAKNIPSFTELTCDDQAVLIKSGIVDALLLRCTESFELEKGYLENPFNGDKFDIHMMYYMGFSALPEPAFEFMRATKACGLNKAEFALLTAVAIIAPDRSDLKNRDLAERMQSLLILTLYNATKHFHPDKPLLFAHLMSKLTTLRDMSVLHLSELMEVKVRETDLSPLVVELFGLDS